MSKGKGKKKQGKQKNESAAPFYVVIPGDKERPFTTEVEVGAYLRQYLANGGLEYIVAAGDGTPLDFEPYAPHLYSREEALDEMLKLRTRARDMLEQIGGFRKTKNEKALQAIAAGLIPVDVIKGHIHQMNYDAEFPGRQQWTLTLSSFGPLLTDDDPLTRALVALTDHLGVPEVGVEDTIGNPGDAAAVVTELPDPLPQFGADL